LYIYIHIYKYVIITRYLTEAEPWKMKGVDESRRPTIVRTTLEALYAFMHLLAPVLPMAAQAGMYNHNIMITINQ
jgi:methionyl-tRNA synthetase